MPEAAPVTLGNSNIDGLTQCTREGLDASGSGAGGILSCPHAEAVDHHPIRVRRPVLARDVRTAESTVDESFDRALIGAGELGVDRRAFLRAHVAMALEPRAMESERDPVVRHAFVANRNQQRGRAGSPAHGPGPEANAGFAPYAQAFE